MGKEGQMVPEMSDDWVKTISDRYIELYEKIIGEKFQPVDLDKKETEEKILNSLQQLISAGQGK
jgi:phosphoribosylaminoimidazole-succinocarboxamide synthase